MSQEIPDSRSRAPRTRRVYSAQFKAELIAACPQPGASIAATAREHSMNANVLHRWLKEYRAIVGKQENAVIICRRSPTLAHQGAISPVSG